MESYMTSCNICGNNFTTSKALKNHIYSAKNHRRGSFVSQPLFCLGGYQISLPKPSDSGKTEAYKAWLSGVVDSINSTMNPKAAGKWCRVERNYCPLPYVEALLMEMPSALANSVKQVSHWRQPVWKKMATKISYKCFEIEEVRSALNEQSFVRSIEQKAFDGYEEVEDMPMMTGREAIAMVKARIRGQDTSNVRVPTCRSSLVIGLGEGRATREFEILWWPNLYSYGNNGKICFRFYVAKTLNA